ncbi:MAG: hypothetical protein EBZ77_00130 [Chitinophagia bacterium]|nr:hypothetical protein [Chitinophagia bacterium]
MRSLILLLLLLCTSSAVAQRIVTTRNLWVRPEVHITFNGYTLSFALKDINKTLKLLESDGTPYTDAQLKLDTGQQYAVELYPGLRMEYQFPVQALIQNVTGAYLMSIGKVEIKDPRQRVVTSFILDVDYDSHGASQYLVTCFDTRRKTMIFQGRLPASLLNRDIGIDD